MKKTLLTLTTVLTLGLLASSAQAQQDRPRGGPPEGRPGGAGFRGPINPLLAALDTDRNGELSSEEINNATAALKALDKNNDGKVDREELRPAGRRFGDRSGDGFADRIMAMDENGDGKVTADEMPERMQRLLQRADTNNDGAIDKAEAEALNDRIGRGRRGAPDRRDGDRPRRGEGRPDRPQLDR